MATNLTSGLSPSLLQPSAESTPNRSSLQSTRSARGRSAVDTVVTVPPWARDEPPSPDTDSSLLQGEHRLTDLRSSAAASHSSIGHHSQSNAPSRWWTFTLPRNRENLAPPAPYQAAVSESQPPEMPKLRRATLSFRNRSMSWLHPSHLRRPSDEEQTRQGNTTNEGSRDWNVRINVPSPISPFTLAHNLTPGWDTPWSPRIPSSKTEESGVNSRGGEDAAFNDSRADESRWRQRRKRLTAYILNHHHVPLIFRFTNIMFTSAALAIAVCIRLSEARLGITGVVGSSATIVVIFAPLTLVHVMIAIYLDLFGRPLGLWRTSRKLAHTLFDVLFICAWSAALSLCFDNFFTSLIPCASPSSISWYNELPRPSIPQLESLDSKSRSSICGNQLALICLVGVGLIMYCLSLVINLYRILEKMRYHTPTATFR